MIKRFCDVCDNEIKGEHLKVMFRETIIDGYGETDFNDQSEFCTNCYDEAIEFIKDRKDDPHRKVREAIKEMLGDCMCE